MTWLQKTLQKKMGASSLRRGMNLWPPLFFAGVRIKKIATDFKHVRVQMNLRWYNRNYVGTQFGGSLYSMTDPFYMLMVMKNVGHRFYVWDYSAEIVFKKPATGAVCADFSLTDQVIESIIQYTASGDKHVHFFDIEVKLVGTNEVVAHVKKGVYVRLKPPFRPVSSAA